MATINDKLEQQKAQTRELTEKELDLATGGTPNPKAKDGVDR